MIVLKNSVQSLVNQAKKKINNIDVKDALKLHSNKQFLFIDIRDIREIQKSGRILGAKHVPRGMLEFWLDPESPYYKIELAPEKPKILFCASNWRSALAVKSLNEMGFKNVSHVAGGYDALLKSGFKIKNI